MQPHFNDAETRGEPVSLRHASEASIHGRFGYGTASHHVEYELDSRRGRLPRTRTRQRPRAAGQGDEALRLPPAVHDRHRRQPGDIARFPRL
jgi:hypothetical protein